MPLKIIGDEKDPSHVVIELSGRVNWEGSTGFLEGITFRRPRNNDDCDEKAMLQLESGNSLSMTHVTLEGAREKISNAIQERVTGSGICVRGRLRMDDVSDFLMYLIGRHSINCYPSQTKPIVFVTLLGNTVHHY
jgi:hypothetical protein